MLRVVDPAPISGRAWSLAQQLRDDPQFVQEFVPEGDDIDFASEHLIIWSFERASMRPASELAAVLDAGLRARLSDGRCDVHAIESAPNAVLLVMSVEGDTLLEDRFEVQSHSDAGHAVRMIIYAARATPAIERIQAGIRLVGGAEIDWSAHAAASRRTEPAVLPDEDILEQIRETLQESFPLIGQTAHEFYRQLALKVRPELAPDLRAGLNVSFALQLLENVDEEDPQDVEFALHLLRWALDSMERGSPLWGIAALSIGRAYELLDDAANAEKAFHVALTTFLAVKDGVNASNVLGQIARLRMRTAREDRNSVAEAVSLAAEARSGVSSVTNPIDWARLTLILGDAHRALAKFDGPVEEVAAQAVYREIIDAFSRRESIHPDQNATVAAVTLAVNRLRDLERKGIPDPVVPPELHQIGSVLLLRPLEIAGRVLLPNEFRDPSVFLAKWQAEPDPVTVEAALYRALETYYVASIGGYSEAFGATRFIVDGGGDYWKTVFESAASAATFVLMIPAGSEGVRWELAQLEHAGLLSKCLFVQPPPSPDFDVPALWAGAVDALRSAGIEPPQFDPRGLLFRVDASGAVAETLSFDVVWQNRLAERVKLAFGVPELRSDPLSWARGGTMSYLRPFQVACRCGLEMTIRVLLLTDIDSALPPELIEGHLPIRECTSCHVQLRIDAPFMAVDFHGSPHLIYVPMEDETEESKNQWLRDLLQVLKVLAPAEWNNRWIKEMRVTDRSGFAAMLRARRPLE